MKRLLIITLLFSACMSVKRATEKVLADPAAKEQVGRQWEKENPCPPPTKPVIKSDTTYLPGDTVLTAGDTTYVAGDTVIITLPGKVITKPAVIIRDSVPYDNTDYRRLGILQDSLSQYKTWLTSEKQLTAKYEAEHKSPLTMYKYYVAALVGTVWFWVFVVLVLGTAGLFIYLKIRK